jgi:tRNA pseudouridine55 synthase
MPAQTFDFVNGEILLVNKPYQWTSFDVVNKVRYAIKLKKIGHAGTLDPMATGLLILCTGKLTKQLESLQGLEKEYTGTLVLGQTTPSFDAETEVDSQTDPSHLTEAQVRAATAQFVGEQAQVPPMFSAVKIDGERLYKKARRGEEVEVQPRTITIGAFELTALRLPEVDFRVVCSKGTYIRSLVRDFGRALGVGAYMTALCRTRIGPHRLADAWEVADLVQTIREARPVAYPVAKQDLPPTENQPQA